MKILFFFLFILLPPDFNEFELLHSISITANSFKVDHLGNIYTLNNDVLVKYDSDGKLFKTYSNKMLGNITFIDVSNPLKLILFYRNFSQIVFLDNMLTPKENPIVMEEIGFQQASLVCSSYNNGLWIYNLQNSELIRLDQNLKPVLKTGNVAQLLHREITPNFLIEHNNFLYLNDANIGVLIFDIYGTYYKTIPISGLNEFQIKDDNIFYYLNKKMKTFNMKSFEVRKLDLPDSSSVTAKIEKDKLFLLRPNKLDIYSIR